VGQNWLPLSLIKYIGAVPTERIIRPRKLRMAAAVGACRKMAHPMLRLE
jgi:hypothetical protein